MDTKEKTPAAGTLATASASGSAVSGAAVAKSPPLTLTGEEEAFVKKHWIQGSWWHDSGKCSILTAGPMALLGCFARRVLNQEITSPCPLPTANPGVYDSNGNTIEISAVGNKKEHSRVLSHILRPLGFRIAISNDPKSPLTFAQELSNAEVAIRIKGGPRPHFDARLWFRHFDVYREEKTSLAAYWSVVLGREWCVERPDMSFLFGGDRNPVTPLIAYNAEAGNDPTKMYERQLTKSARGVYLLYVTLQMWLCANNRWGVESKFPNKEVRPINIFMVDIEDFTSDDPSSTKKVTESLLRERPYVEAKDLPPEVLRDIDASPKPQILKDAFQFCHSASKMSFGRFYTLVVQRLYQANKEEALADAKVALEKLKKNVLNNFGSAKFTFGEITNILSHYSQAMTMASTELIQLRMYDNIKPKDVQELSMNRKSIVPAVNNRQISTVTTGGSLPPIPFVLAHNRFSHNAPICTWNSTPPEKSEALETVPPDPKRARTEVVDASGKMDIGAHRQFYWRLVEFMNKDHVKELDDFVVKNRFVDNIAFSTHANARSYFLNSSNEDNSVLVPGARSRYLIYNPQNDIYDSYASPSFTQPMHRIERASLSKFRSSAVESEEGEQPTAAAGAKRKRSKSKDAKDGDGNRDPLLPSGFNSVHEPLMQSVRLLMHYQAMPRPSDKARMQAIGQTLKVLCAVLSDPAKLRDCVLYNVFIDLASRFTELDTWLLLTIADMKVNSSERLAPEVALRHSLRRLDALWHRGTLVAAERKAKAVKLCCSNTPRQGATSDRKVLHSVFLAFNRDRPTYDANTLQQVNREFHRHFFTRDLVMGLLETVGYSIRVRLADGTVTKELAAEKVSDIIDALVNVVKDDSFIRLRFSAELRAFFEVTDFGGQMGQIFSSCTNDGDEPESPLYIGYGVLRHVCDLWVKHVKHPIFFYAAYISNPPVGATFGSTGCEWVPMSDGTRKGKFSALKADSVPVTALATLPSGRTDLTGVEKLSNSALKSLQIAHERNIDFVKLASGIVRPCISVLKKDSILKSIPHLLDADFITAPDQPAHFCPAFFVMLASAKTSISNAKNREVFLKDARRIEESVLRQLIRSLGFKVSSLRRVSDSDSEESMYTNPEDQKEVVKAFRRRIQTFVDMDIGIRAEDLRELAPQALLCIKFNAPTPGTATAPVATASASTAPTEESGFVRACRYIAQQINEVNNGSKAQLRRFIALLSNHSDSAWLRAMSAEC